MEVEAEATERANELYWDSERSVNQIADDLGLSKGALYGMIRPLPVEGACPDCGADVVYANRTAKDRGRVDCLQCAWTGSESQTGSYKKATGAGNARGSGTEEGAGPARTAGSRLLTRVLERDRARTIAGGALLGAAVGLALVIWARRR
jgi:hypothetical protein